MSLDAPLLDAAAVAFTRAFYQAIAVGDGVKRAFDSGVASVAASPRVAGAGGDAATKADKFLLLPADGDHGARLLPRGAGAGKAPAPPPGPPPRWPPRATLPPSAPRPPEDFLGREVDAYKALDALSRRKRLVALTGPRGAGKSALAAFVAEYRSQSGNLARRSILQEDDARVPPPQNVGF